MDDATSRSKILKALDIADSTDPNEDVASLDTSNDASHLIKAMDDAIKAVDNDDDISDTFIRPQSKTLDEVVNDSNKENETGSVTEDEAVGSGQSHGGGGVVNASTEAQAPNGSNASDQPPSTPNSVSTWSSTPEKVFKEINGYVSMEIQQLTYTDVRAVTTPSRMHSYVLVVVSCEHLLKGLSFHTRSVC